MENQRKFFTSSSDQDYNTDTAQGKTTETSNKQQGDAADPSYYFAYGPYQSGQSSPDKTTSMDSEGQASDVEVTQPSPVKPMPFSSTTRQSYANYGSGGSDSGSGNDGSVHRHKHWSFNHKGGEKTRTSFKSMFASFLAGAVVVTSLMFAADYTNLFTGDQASTATSGTNETAQTVVNNQSSASVPFPDGASSVTEVVKSASPAVVKIETFTTATSNAGSNNWWMDDPLFRQFFSDSYGNRSGQGSNSESDSSTKELTPLGIGTGFIFDQDGYILTNNHVIDGGESIQVTIEGYEKPLTATVLGTSSDLDLAVLKVESDGDLPTVSLGDSDAAEVGEQVVAIGNPSGFDHTVTSGWLSAKDRSIDISDDGTTKTYDNLLQTDAAINPGNSGGPLLNMKGEVIGMNVAVSQDSQGIGFAIPSNVITNVLDNLKENKEIPKDPLPFIGASLITMTEDIANQIGVENVEGALVYQVVLGSPAYEAELRAYDIITAVDGEKITTKEELIEVVQSKQVGDKVTLSVKRLNKTADVEVTIGDKNNFQTTE